MHSQNRPKLSSSRSVRRLHHDWYRAVKDRLMNLELAAKPGKKSNDLAEWLDMREAVEYAMDLLGVKTVFVDEAQHLMT